ncbi:helix-turn-helix domain-containing protein [Chryseobacterium sp. LAM-KRS1]|uniref:helix-turn-helix domain-containing protein n=1 Tax=Chryseobacterium sp. LAM-KRS1 TaxID=2715754 RepID=UPI001552020D|nr:AraC family transcriptional regulator [Chryseobacterium sp. LAM-KRS1]
MQILPSAVLAPYVKNYTVVTIGKDITDAVFYPSGYIDLIINISGGSAATIINGKRKDTPSVELLGHITLPTRLTVLKNTTVLIVRIYPHASTLFFDDPVSEFTNYATDMYDVTAESTTLYDRIMMAGDLSGQVKIVEDFLLQQMRKNENRLKKVSMVLALSKRISFDHQPLNLNRLSEDSGLSERYIQKLYMNNIGISPAAFTSVIRFNRSLHLVLNTRSSLTSIAYDCGYYDQAHFIREFKRFTGIVPSESRSFLIENGKDFQEAVNVGF